MVGFQNQLKFSEQERIFRLIPGLERAEFIRFGQMHRNTYINAPALLLPTLNLRASLGLFFCGQLCGVEGYVESIATGLLAGLNALRHSLGEPLFVPPRSSALGSIVHYLAAADRAEFAPIRFTFDLLPAPERFAPEAETRETRRAAACIGALRALQDRLQRTGTYSKVV